MLDVYRSYSPIDVVFQSGFGVGRQDSKPVGIVVSEKKMIIVMALWHVVVVNALKVNKIYITTGIFYVCKV